MSEVFFLPPTVAREKGYLVGLSSADAVTWWSIASSPGKDGVQHW